MTRDRPAKIVMMPPAPMVYDPLPEITEAHTLELPLEDERGAPTLGGLLWSTLELHEAATAVIGATRSDARLFDFVRSVRAVAATTLRQGYEQAQLPGSDPSPEMLSLFRSLVASATAMRESSARVAFPNDTTKREFCGALDEAREILEALEAVRMIRNEDEPRADFEPVDFGTRMGSNFRSLTSLQRGTLPDVAGAIRDAVRDALRQHLPVAIAVDAIDVHAKQDDNRLSSAREITIRVDVKLSAG